MLDPYKKISQKQIGNVGFNNFALGPTGLTFRLEVQF